VLGSVARQRQAPHEILIADDGSGPATQAVIASFLAAVSVTARVISQPHQGFRAARLRNLAIAASGADYLVFIDGDMLLHPEFIADHARHARRGFYTQGIRVQTSERLTSGLVAGASRWPDWWSRGVGLLRRAYLIHSPRFATLGRRLGNRLVALKSCNQAFWRDDLVRVNGFDEDFVGWGPEDKELCARLEHAGIRRQTLLCGGIACHLRHPPASRAQLAANLALLERTRRERRIRCVHGVDAHLPS
jgi:glycosyltransferase involved in cell wall biosynthesis